MSQTVEAFQQSDILGELLRRKLATEHLQNFTTFTKPDYEVNWHHELMFNKLDKFVSGEIKRLIISCPPRNGKSEIVSRRLPAYLFGKIPSCQIIACSYSADLAQRMNRDVQRIIDSPLYHSLFPDIGLNASNVRTTAQGSYLRNSDIFEIVGEKGVYRSSGIGGGITGMGFNYGIIDDYFKNREEAESPTIRDKVYEWYTDVFLTRAEKDASILITATRWHEDDLIGRLLKLAETTPEADQWEVITLPALSEESRPEYDLRTEPNLPLWPGKYSIEVLRKIRATVPLYTWLSLYQQRPSAAAGNLFKREFFKYCTLKDNILDLGSKKVIFSDCKIYQTCDPAASTKTTADFFALGTWAQTPDNDLVLLDVLKTRLEGPNQVNLFKQQYARWKPAVQYVESAGVGKTLYQMLVREGLPVKELKADTDKVTRALPAAARLEAGTVYFLLGGNWLGDFEEELLSFPNGAHDDQCLVAGTLISTDKGLIPIEKLNTSYKVLTRQGYKDIEHCGRTSKSSEVISITFKNGKTLTGTRHHPIYVIGKGFIPLDTISYGDKVLSEYQTLKKFYSMELYSEDTQIQNEERTGVIIPQTVFVDTKDTGRYIKRSGNITMGKYRRDMLSIIKTKTPLTTLLKTLNVSHQPLILKNIVQKHGKILNTPRVCGNILRKLDHLLKNGISLKKGENGTLKTQKKHNKTKLQLNESVPNAERNITQKQSGLIQNSVQVCVLQDGGVHLESTTRLENVYTVGQNSLLTDIQKQHIALEVVHIKQEQIKQKVYNLSVKDAHEYFANGVLVHNCDCFSYAVNVLIASRNLDKFDLSGLIRSKKR